MKFYIFFALLAVASRAAPIYDNDDDSSSLSTDSLDSFDSDAPVLADFSETSVEVDEQLSKDADTFYVSVARFDMLVNTRNDEIMAERLGYVELKFDVVEGQKLRCNGFEIPVGMSNIQMEISEVIKLADDVPYEIVDEFDGGLVSVDFLVEAQEMEIEGVRVRRLTISERIVEVKGAELATNDYVQQLIDIYPNGEVREVQKLEQKQPTDFKKLYSQFSHWFIELPPAAQIALALVYGLLGVSLLISFAFAIVSSYRRFYSHHGTAGYKYLKPAKGFVQMQEFDEQDEKLLMRQKKAMDSFYSLGSAKAVSSVDISI